MAFYLIYFLIFYWFFYLEYFLIYILVYFLAFYLVIFLVFYWYISLYFIWYIFWYFIFERPGKRDPPSLPGQSLYVADPLQIITIIIIIINIIIIIIIRLEIRIFRHPFSKYLTIRWKWQIRASIDIAKRNIGVCSNIDRIFFLTRYVCLTIYTSK